MAETDPLPPWCPLLAGSVIGAGDADALGGTRSLAELVFESRLLAVSPAARDDARRLPGIVTLLWSTQIDGIRTAWHGHTRSRSRTTRLYDRRADRITLHAIDSIVTRRLLSLLSC